MNIPMSPTTPPPSQKGGGRHLRSHTSWIPSRGRHVIGDESDVGLNPASIPNLHYSSASLESVKWVGIPREICNQLPNVVSANRAERNIVFPGEFRIIGGSTRILH